MSNEENEKNIKTEQVLQNDRVKKPFNKKILIVVIIGIFLLLIFGIIVFSSNSNTEYIDGDKIDVSKIKLSLSSDYKYFNNSITDFAAVIINDFNSNNVTVKSHSNCSSNDFNTTYCYNIILNNNDKLYILSNSNENFV